MHYDRNAAQRTNVIDDQSDYFEIDSNAWLTDQVGLIAVLDLTCLGPQCVGGLCASKLPAWAWKRHEGLMCAAVPCDSLQLLLWVMPGILSAASSGARTKPPLLTADSLLSLQERAELKERARISAEAEAARAKRVTVTVDLLGRRVLMAQEAEPSQDPVSAASDAAAAAAATSREIPQGGGTAAGVASEAAERHAARIARNPALKGPAPMFVKAAQEPSAQQGGPQQTAGATPSARQQQHRWQQGQPRPARLQHDEAYLTEAGEIAVA